VSATTDTAPSLTRSADWRQHYHGPHHRGVNFVETALSPATVGSLRSAWTYGGSSSMSANDPITADGTVFVVVRVLAGKSKLLALDAATGAVRWNKFGNFGGTPALMNGRLYVEVPAPAFPTMITALDPATGATIWSTPVPQLEDFTVTSDAVYAAGFGFTDRVDALDARTGRVLWRYSSLENQVATAPVASDGIVYFGQSSGVDGELRALDAATGAVLWRRTGVIPGGPLSIDHGVLFVGTWSHRVEAFRAKTGTRLWATPAGDIVFTVPAVNDGLVFSGSLDSHVYALNSHTGRVR
jgi:eukaryotic-like serine/threonine-protein kinase